MAMRDLPSLDPSDRFAREKPGVMMNYAVLTILPAALMASAPVAASEPGASSAPLEVEESDTADLPALSPHWIIAENNWASGASRIFDGDTGKMLGQITLSSLANSTTDPLGRYFFTAESIWTKQTRGTRQDFLTVRDARTLKILRDIPLPGRLLVGNRKYSLGVSGDGTLAFIYNMDPASSVTIVDIAAGRVLRTVEVPGCAMTTGFGRRAAISLCSDGSAGLVTTSADGKRSELKASAPFFTADSDPVFDNFAVNSVSGEAVFLTYSGKVFVATAAQEMAIAAPWSLQEAAGYPAGVTTPQSVNWYPGGRQPLAYSKAADRLFVLMHMGEYWSQKVPGQELWTFEASTRKLLKRTKLEDDITDIAVSQDESPLLFLGSEENLHVWDAMTLEEKHVIAEASHGMLSVPVAGW